MDRSLDGVTIVIPAYKPDDALIPLVNELGDIGFSDFIVVDDGSGDEFSGIFDSLKNMPACTVLSHPENLGKGAALRTAFEYFKENRTDKSGLVTADADGQHLPEDIAKCAADMLETGKFIIGARDFSGEDVPARSRFGNRITSVVFRLFFGMKISDTQTGLRAIPSEFIEDMLAAKGERYEFETNSLLMLKKRDIPYAERKISTVYLNENRSSHFRVFRDSLRIYSTIIRYILSSLASSGIDHVLFFAFNALFVTEKSMLGTFVTYVVARSIAAVFNYFLNFHAVFGKEKGRHPFLRYLTIAVPLMLISAFFVMGIGERLSIINPYLKSLVKMIVDTILFFASFRIQHQWVFNSKNSKKLK